MRQRTSLSRRHLIGGLGAAGAAVVAGARVDPAAAVNAPGYHAYALPNPVVQNLGSIDFIAIRRVNSSPYEYNYVQYGGVEVLTGEAYYHAGLTLPVGVTITGIRVFVNPRGIPFAATLRRYDPISGAGDVLAVGTTSGPGAEAFALSFPSGIAGHTIEGGGRNYAIADVRLAGPSGPVLYGAEVTYTVPADPEPLPPPAPPPPTPDPNGYFVPFTGSVPRVYDSRVGGQAKLAADEERVVALGVAGTVQAALVNLTVTETGAGGGFVACFPADSSWPGTSSINWTAAESNVANLVVTGVDPAGQIRLRAGNAATHVVVDLVGTFA